jgi:RNA polymerase sigma factor (sigma-70 family)
MRASGELQQPPDDDLLQEGRLAVGEAVRTWDAGKGALSTWVCARVRYAVLNYLNKQHSGGINSRAYKVRMTELPPDEVESDGLEDDDASRRAHGRESPQEMTYADPPEGYANPSEEAAGAVLVDQLRFALGLLKGRDYAVIDALYGLESEPLTATRFAQDTGLSRAGVYVRLNAALARLTTLMGEAAAVSGLSGRRL